ncbi:MAG: restriction endonuclease [Clostridia bacterium]
MAKLNFIDKGQIEELFGMESGYVLDFTNRTLQEFIYEMLEVDIYLKYPSLSKAKILRNIFNEYDSIKVGKLILELLRYMQNKDMVDKSQIDLFKKVADIGNQLIGKNTVQVKKHIEKEVEPIKSTINYDFYVKELQRIYGIEEPQKRGYEFETYLCKLFNSFDLEPRGSFKIVGEQIDGSFVLHNEVYLLEAKWTKATIDKGDLVVFNEKVSSKSGVNRGLFISLSGYTDETIKNLSNGRIVNIILMNAAE